MIFAILDDRGLVVHASIDDACHGHEPIDVENGDVRFFDHDGWPLDAVFIVPNQCSKVLGVTIIEQGELSAIVDRAFHLSQKLQTRGGKLD